MYKITVQRLVSKDTVPASTLLKKWTKAALKNTRETAELNIRIVDINEMTELNKTYRHKNGPTNVLSFPFDMPSEIEEELYMLGDIVICADVVNTEAHAQQKTTEAHWAHIVVHGTLHLLGYDHETEADANVMESKEINILIELGFQNPYLLTESDTKQ